MHLPEVYAQLEDGRYWTKVAEGALYAYYRPSAAIGED